MVSESIEIMNTFVRMGKDMSTTSGEMIGTSKSTGKFVVNLET